MLHDLKLRTLHYGNSGIFLIMGYIINRSYTLTQPTPPCKKPIPLMQASFLLRSSWFLFGLPCAPSRGVLLVISKGLIVDDINPAIP